MNNFIMKFNHSPISEQLSTLIVDRIGKTTKFAKENTEQFDEAISRKFHELFDLKEGQKLDYYKFKQHEYEMYAIINETLRVTVPEGLRLNEFLSNMAEIRDISAGDSVQFDIPDKSIKYVSRFSGHHWDTDRQRNNGKRSFTPNMDWYYVRLYEDFQRVLQGNASVEEMFINIGKAITKHMNDQIVLAWNTTSDYLPTEFKKGGTFITDTMLGLIELVSAYAETPDVTLVGTQRSLRLMNAETDGSPSLWMSNNMKDQMNSNGFITTWNGYRTVVLPQVLIPGTYNFALSDRTIRVIPNTGDGYKPIKVLLEGDYRILNLEPTQNIAQQYDFQTQYKMGAGVAFNTLYGEYVVA